MIYVGIRLSTLLKNTTKVLLWIIWSGAARTAGPPGGGAFELAPARSEPEAELAFEARSQVLSSSVESGHLSWRD